MKDKVLLYHDRCPDGYGSRWAFETIYGNAMQYIPMNFDRDIPVDLKNKEVFIADFSFSRKKILEIKESAKSLILLDHHITAKRELDDLPYCKIDVSRSGAVLSWMYTRNLEDDSEVPEILKLVEDRDLWKFTIADSKSILAALDSREFDFDAWSNFDKNLSKKETRERILLEGDGILRYKEATVERALHKKHKIKILGHVMWACNVIHLHSEVAGQLSKIDGFDVGCAYHFDGKKYIFSLRSDNKKQSPFDVSLLAEKFGGGGHKTASGFSVSPEIFNTFLIM